MSHKRKHITRKYSHDAKTLCHKYSKNYLHLSYKNVYYQVILETILFVEYHQRRIKLRTTNEVIFYKHMLLSKFTTYLPKEFIQIHQSFIVNSAYISHIKMSTLSLKIRFYEQDLPIGRHYKENILEFLCNKQ
ncbi:MAG: LytTR family transcriptional regulator [Clostridia bacterium]|nr:LytTR family transcriptional regulator [Clostridia bacterium]